MIHSTILHLKIMHITHILIQTEYDPLVEIPGKLGSGSIALLMNGSARWTTRSDWIDPFPPSDRDAKFSVGLSPSPNSDAGVMYG